MRFSNVVVGGGFSLAYENFGERFDGSFPAEVFFFFSSGNQLRAHQFHSLGQHYSTVAQPAETTVEERTLTSCV